MSLYLVVETERGELIAAVGAHVFLAKRLRVLHEKRLGVPVQVRDIGGSPVSYLSGGRPRFFLERGREAR